MEKRNEMTIYEKQSRERINYLIANFCDGSQQRFCEKTRLNKSSVSQYVNGKNLPGNITSSKIAKVFNVNPAWIMGFDVPMNLPTAPIEPAAVVANPAAGPSSVAPVQLRPDESEMLDKYNLLNDLGRNKAYEYVSDLTENEKYIQGLEESNRVG